MTSSCELWGLSQERNCHAWRPYAPCGFKDVSTIMGNKWWTARDVFGTAYSTVGPALTLDEVHRVLDDLVLGLDMDGPDENTDFEPDMVDAPPHYEFIKGEFGVTLGWEVKDIIKIAVKKNFPDDGVKASMYWQVLKYLLRCGCKGATLQDVKKSEHYLKDLIDELVREEEDGSL